MAPNIYGVYMMDALYPVNAVLVDVFLSLDRAEEQRARLQRQAKPGRDYFKVRYVSRLEIDQYIEKTSRNYPGGVLPDPVWKRLREIRQAAKERAVIIGN